MSLKKSKEYNGGVNIKNHYCCSLQNKDRLFKWVIEELAPVLLVIKPLEILSFPKIGNRLAVDSSSTSTFTQNII